MNKKKKKELKFLIVKLLQRCNERVVLHYTTATNFMFEGHTLQHPRCSYVAKWRNTTDRIPALSQNQIIVLLQVTRMPRYSRQVYKPWRACEEESLWKTNRMLRSQKPGANPAICPAATKMLRIHQKNHSVFKFWQ